MEDQLRLAAAGATVLIGGHHVARAYFPAHDPCGARPGVVGFWPCLLLGVSSAGPIGAAPVHGVSDLRTRLMGEPG
jgi:hypothetical protein